MTEPPRLPVGCSDRAIATAAPPPADRPNASEGKERNRSDDEPHDDVVHSAPPFCFIERAHPSRRRTLCTTPPPASVGDTTETKFRSNRRHATPTDRCRSAVGVDSLKVCRATSYMKSEDSSTTTHQNRFCFALAACQAQTTVSVPHKPLRAIRQGHPQPFQPDPRGAYTSLF